MNVPAPQTRITQYEVTCLPEEDINADTFTIRVEYRGRGSWAVTRYGRCLSRSGVWDYEPSPSAREDDWLENYRFDLDTALRLAQEHAPKVIVNGHTVAQALARTEESK